MKRLSYLLLLIALSWHSAASADLAESLQQANSDYRAGQIASAQRQYETLLDQTTWGQPGQVAVKFQTIQALTSLYRKTSNLAGLIEVTDQLIEFSNSEIFSQIHQLTKSATYAMVGLNRWTALLATGETETALREIEDAYQSPGERQPTRSFNHPWLSPYFESINFLYGAHLARSGRRTDADLVVHRAVVGAAIEEGRNPGRSHWTLMKLADHYLETGRLVRGGRILSALKPTAPHFIGTAAPERLMWLKMLLFEWAWTGKKEGYEHLAEQLESFLSTSEIHGRAVNSSWLWQALWAWKILATETGNAEEFDRIDRLEKKYFGDSSAAHLESKATDLIFKTRLALKANRPIPEFPSDTLLRETAGATNHFPEMLHLARSNQHQISGEITEAVTEGVRAFQVARDKYHASQMPNLWTVQPYRFFLMVTENLISLAANSADQGPLGDEFHPEVLADVIEQLLRLRSPTGAYFAGARGKVHSKKFRANAKRRELYAKQYELFVDQMIQRLIRDVENAATWQAPSGLPSEAQLKKERAAYIEFMYLTSDLYSMDRRLWNAVPEYFSDSRLSVVRSEDLVEITDAESAIVWLTFGTQEEELLRLCFDGSKYFLAKQPISRSELVELIAQMRQTLTSYQGIEGLDLDSRVRGFSVQRETNQSPSGFLEHSHQLFESVFSGIEGCATGKSKLLLRADPVFYSLPINALVVDHKNPASPEWFFDHYAYEFLSSVNPRIETRQSQKDQTPPDEKSFIGLGDFIPHGDLSLDELPQNSFTARGAATGIDLTSLEPLPNTRIELETIATSFGPNSSQLFLGGEATERNFRQSQPEAFSTIAFATHALVAGEFDGLSEPALVLTKGEGSDSFDDGLLTASELSSIDLAADLVILSACNTALSDGTPNAQGLGALANSFLFSGTKATIVSQWPVKDQVAPLITEQIVKEIIRNKGIGEALRSSLKSLVEDKGYSKFHHPSFWAPFIPISQGVRQNLIKDDSPALQPNWEEVNEEGHLSEAQAVAVSRDHAFVVSQGFMHSTVNQMTAHGWLDLRDQNNEAGIRIAFPDLASGGDVIVDEQHNIISTWSTFPLGDLSKIDTVIIKTDMSGKEIWRKQLGDPARADLPLAIVDLPDGTYIAFISVEDYKNTSHEYWIYLLTSDGEIKDKTKLASFPEHTFTPTFGVTAIANNQLLVSWVDKTKGRAFPESSPITGLSNEVIRLAHDSYATVLEINLGKLSIGEITTIPKTALEDLTSANGKVFALASKIDEGSDRLGNTVVYEIKNKGRQLEIVELFKTGGATHEFLKKLVVLSNGDFVIAGYFSDDKRYERTEIFEETGSGDSEDLTLERNAIQDFLLAKEFNPEQVHSAFLSVFDQSGRLIDDYVGVSPTGASFSDAVVIDGKSFVAAGGGGKNGSTLARFTLH